jgi:DNA-binding MarR family transcriptional regulator
MSKKEKFIEEITKLLQDSPENFLSSDALDYWHALATSGTEGDKPQFTANGKLILGYMQQNKDAYNNLFKAKDIGEGLGISTRTASGAMRKLVTDEFIEKVGQDPIIYSITEKGLTANLNEA